MKNDMTNLPLYPADAAADHSLAHLPFLLPLIVLFMHFVFGFIIKMNIITNFSYFIALKYEL